MARKHARQSEDVAIDSFVKEAGLDVNRPPAETALEQVHGNVMIAISENGDIWMSKRQVEMEQVRLLIQQAQAENPEGTVVIIADEAAPTGIVVQVMDQARLGGADQVAIAAEEAATS